MLDGDWSSDVCSFDLLPVGQARLAAYCSAKGRMLASFIVWREGPEAYALACSADLLAPTLKRLGMFVLRAKCRLSDASTESALWGLVGEAAGATLGATIRAEVWGVMPQGDAQAVRLPDVDGLPRWLAVLPVAQGFDTLPALPPADWAWLEVRSGVARIVAATVEAFVPQMVNFELVGGVSFKKGCYPGQEVVARSQYRGTLKRRGALLQGAVALPPGQAVFHSADPGQPAGTVALGAGPVEGHYQALVELKLAALDGGSLHLGTPDGPVLSLLPLPYALPSNEA
jgi:folate-binding protein YgfZ